jgi:hypothetical protein
MDSLNINKLKIKSLVCLFAFETRMWFYAHFQSLILALQVPVWSTHQALATVLCQNWL